MWGRHWSIWVYGSSAYTVPSDGPGRSGPWVRRTVGDCPARSLWSCDIGGLTRSNSCDWLLAWGVHEESRPERFKHLLSVCHWSWPVKETVTGEWNWRESDWLTNYGPGHGRLTSRWIFRLDGLSTKFLILSALLQKGGTFSRPFVR